MAKRTIANLDFGVGDDGELELTGYDPEEDELELDLDDYVEEDEDEEGDEDGDEEGDEEGDDVEEEEEEEEQPRGKQKVQNLEVARLKKELREFKQGIGQLIADNIAAALQRYMPKGGQQEEDDEFDLEDDAEISNAQMLKMLDKRLDKKIDKQFDKYKPALTQAELQGQFNSAAQKYGQKFIDVIPEVAQLMLDTGMKDPAKAYVQYKKLEKAAAQKIQSRRPQQMTTKLSKNGVRMIPRNAQGQRRMRVESEEDLSPVEKLIRQNNRQRLDADAANSVGEMLPPRTRFKAPKDGSDNDVFDASFNLSMMKTAVGRKKRRA